MTRVCVLSANLGGYDVAVPWVDQVVPAGATVDVHRLNDQNFPPRPKAMTSALQCGIPKMFGWQLFPGYDVYVWVDASRGLLREDTVAWFLERLGAGWLLLFKHPERLTVREEYEFVKAKLAKRSPYLTKRYEHEWLDGQFAAVAAHADAPLYASTAFAYRNRIEVQGMLTNWWIHKSRYCIHDQIALPAVIAQSDIPSGCIRTTSESVYDCVHLPITRQKQPRRAS